MHMRARDASRDRTEAKLKLGLFCEACKKEQRQVNKTFCELKGEI